MTGVGVSFVVPVHNGERWLDEALASILAQRDGRPFEVIAVDDGSVDGSAAILDRHAAAGTVRVLRTEHRGAAAAMNVGIREAAHPVVCLIDQDVVLQPGWLEAILEPLTNPGSGFRTRSSAAFRALHAGCETVPVGAVQGYFATDPTAPVVARVAGMDLEQRYAAIGEGPTSHVCTGNSAYRADALRAAGLFDESFGYGYDNDMSYRLMKAGYALRFCPAAKSVHRWRETLRGYLVQQYGQGYGRLDIVWKHPRWAAGDAVSPSAMMAHAPLMLVALVAGIAALALAAAGLPWRSIGVDRRRDPRRACARADGGGSASGAPPSRRSGPAVPAAAPAPRRGLGAGDRRLDRPRRLEKGR